jgi:hypothetical protein
MFELITSPVFLCKVYCFSLWADYTLNWIHLGINFEISTSVFQKYICTVHTCEVSNNVAKTTRQETITEEKNKPAN